MAGPGSGLTAEQDIPAWRPWLRWLAVTGWAEVVLLLAASRAEAWPLSPVSAFAVGFAIVSSFTLAAAGACPPAGRAQLPWLLLPAASLIAISVSGAGDLDTAVVVTAGLLLGGTLLGAVVGGSVEHAGHLVFVAIVSSAADIFSVFHDAGPSHAIAASERALSVLALPWPMLGTPHVEAFLGAGDVVFTALYLAAARRHGLGARRSLLSLAGAYAATLVAVVLLAAPVPALPALGLAMCLAHPQARRPPPEDRRRGLVLTALVLAVVAGMFLF